MISKPIKIVPPFDDDKKIIALDDLLSSVCRDASRSASGTYVGDGTASRAVELGFSPKFVIIQKSLDYAREPSTAYAPSSNLVWDYTVTRAAVQTVTTNGVVTLDGVAHGGYDFEFEIYNPTAGIRWCALFANNDTTHTNYWVRGVYGGVVVPASMNINYADITLFGIAAGGSATISGTMLVTPTKEFLMNHQTYRSDGYHLSATLWHGALSGDNLTRVDIVADAAGGIGVGSRFRLKKRIVSDTMALATAENPGVTYIPPYGYATNGVLGFTNTGITIGANPNVNLATKTFTYFALG